MRLHNWPAPGQSWQSRLTNTALAATWRPLTQVLPGGRLGTVISRSLISAGLRLASPPRKDASFERVEQPVASGLTVRGEWVRTPRTRGADGVVLYLHGSGYVVCSSRTHRGLTSELADRTGLSVFSIDYRLAPSFTYPAAPQDVRAAWDWLHGQGHDPSRIVVAGDSAGGHLAVTLCLELARAGEALPAGLVCLSPVVDLALERGIPRDRIEHDPFAAASVAVRLLDTYADAAARADDGLRISFDDIDAFPPTLVHAGSREMLGSDCTELARRIRNAGFEVTHRVWPGQMHVFQAMTAVIPESGPALDEIARFIGDRLPAAAAAPHLAIVRSAG